MARATNKSASSSESKNNKSGAEKNASRSKTSVKSTAKTRKTAAGTSRKRTSSSAASSKSSKSPSRKRTSVKKDSASRSIASPVKGAILPKEKAAALKKTEAAGALKKAEAAGALKKAEAAGPLKKTEAAGALKKTETAGALKKTEAAGALKKTEAAGALKKAEDGKIRVLYCSPEVRPFSGTGGLSEVAGSLPKALCQSGKIDCRVITPLYRSIPRKYRDKMEFLGWTMIPVAWRTKYMGVFSMEWDGVLCYFIDNEEYFDRDGLYGYYNDCERFAFFSRAVFESLRLTGFTPDIVHANDWQTAMVPVYQDAIYHRRFLTTVFTIHNIEYQGSYGKEVIRDVLGLPEGSEHLVEYGDGVNLLKGGIDTANLVSTVSPTYASELRDPISAFGLDGIVRASYGKFRGILNGIDTDSYNPASDPIIAANYTPEDPSGKEICHSHLQKLAGLPEKNVPILSLISRLVPAKGMDLLRETLDRILSEEDVQLIVLGTGFPEYEDFFRGLEARWPEKVRSWITFNIGRSHEIYAGSDIFLMPSRSEPCGLSQMIAMRYGTVPVVRATGGLRDSVKDCTFGDGTGFVFDEYSGDAFYNAVKQALALKRNTENWEKLKIHDMKQDFSWKHSAEEYIQMYEQVRYH